MLLHAPLIFAETIGRTPSSFSDTTRSEIEVSSKQLLESTNYPLSQIKSVMRGFAGCIPADNYKQVNQDCRIVQALKNADFERELSVAFQPIVDIRSRMTIGFEALARWTSPTVGSVPPAQFIPIAERAGIVGILTQPLLKKALASATQWPRDLRLAFNLSACDLSSADSTLDIINIIERSGFDQERLDLEFTETAFGHDFEQVQRSVEMLRLLGCGISLDDFGTGYSNLSRLHTLPLTKMKIDRSFVTGLHESPTSLKIVKSLLGLSRDMGLDCVIEGVETSEELAALRKLGGLLVQGYFYSPPIIDEEVAAFVDRYNYRQHDARPDDPTLADFRSDRRRAIQLWRENSRMTTVGNWHSLQRESAA
jgi:predicted signal transduction protein with EAL and GGDEF domain